MTAPTIRLAAPGDAGQVAAIYAPFVSETPVSFELDPPDTAEMARRIKTTRKNYPWLVCDKDGEIAGYAYASQHRTRSAYQWSVDTAIYTGAAFRQLGIGRSLYSALLSVLPLQGFYNAYAGIALPNAASVGLHEAMGFEPVGIYRQVGFKFGRWHDVGWWQRPLQPYTSPAAEPTPLDSVARTDEFASCLERAGSLLRW